VGIRKAAAAAIVPALIVGVGIAVTLRAEASTTAPAVATSVARLLANPGFEASSASPTSWTHDGAVAVVGTAHSGTGAAEVTDASTASGVSLRGAPIATVPGEDLTATIWMNRGSGTGGSLYLEFWRADGSRTTSASVAAGTAAGWQQLTVRGIAPDDAVTATVLAYSNQADAGVTDWDDAAVSALPPPLRKLPNAGFEERRNPSTPTEWTVSAPGGSVGFAVGRNGDGRNGDTAVKTADTSTTGEVSVLSRQVPVSVGETITASVWAEHVSGSAGTLYLEFRNASGVRLGTPPTVSTGTGTAWHQVTVSGTAPSGAAGLTLRLYSTQTATGTVLWDDVSLRSSADSAYDPALAAAATVLFVGDQRIESSTGVSRVMHPGTKQPPPFAGTGGATWDANPRLSGSVLPVGTGYGMWYVTSSGTGYATSTDGINWNRNGRTSVVTPRGDAGVVPNAAWTSGSSLPKYFKLRPGDGDDSDRHYYYMDQSTDGITWTPVPGAQRFTGWDVANVTYDPVTRRYVAMSKQVPVNYNPPSVAPGPRTAWVSTSTDFKTWTTPQPSFAADALDDARVPAGTGKHGMTPWTEVYGMPAIRYGDQFLGTPWVFDIGYSPHRDNGDPGADTGRSHIELAATRDLVNWSRPDRDDLITPGASGQWDYGFQMTGTTFDTVRLNDGTLQSRFWYSSFAGEHSCDAVGVSAGNCAVPTGSSSIDMVTWPADRFESFHAAAGGGSVTTRPLTPAGRTLTVNYDPGTSGGSLRVEVLDANGNPISGYGAADATAITSNAVAPGTTVTWGGQNALPTGVGPLRLRFGLTGGDLYAFNVS
jgi:hypothetical protein